MTTALAHKDQALDSETVLKLASGGDCSGLSDSQKLAYYRARCEAAGLDPRVHPFEFTKLDGKLVLYARKAAADGLVAKHGLSTKILERKTEGSLHTVVVRAETRDHGQSVDDIGVVLVGSLQGAFLANALMKAVTKAKRRAVLSLCGLGMLDETEVEDIHKKEAKEAKVVPHHLPPPEEVATVEDETTAVDFPLEHQTEPLTADERRRDVWARLQALGFSKSAAAKWAGDVGGGPSASWTGPQFSKVEAALSQLEEEKREGQA